MMHQLQTTTLQDTTCTSTHYFLASMFQQGRLYIVCRSSEYRSTFLLYRAYMMMTPR